MPGFLTRRKMIDVLCVLVIIAIGAYWFTSPYFAVRNLKAAIVDADEQALGEMIDFPVLRENLKDQLKSGMDRWAVEYGRPEAVAGMALTGPIVDRLIDVYVTPAGLVRMASKVDVPDNADLPFTALSGSIGARILDQEDYVIDRGLRSFSLVIQTKNVKGDEIEIVFEGNGLRWVLVNVILPLNGPG
ncbi:MAG: DUF2939 domain-containing protein [Gemmatimonadetes bacterium]|nr:DUF2939 domain-containing protein [Gemmatimonadota bacterium]